MEASSQFDLIIESDADQLAARFARDFARLMDTEWAERKKICVALSGGNTPGRLFKIWAAAATQNQQSPDLAVDRDRVHFFWGDERCVPPDNSQSNYGVANQLFLEPAGIAKSNIHRIMGETDPEIEQQRSGSEIQRWTAGDDGNPKFDLVMLGLGDDGHTASIFPCQIDLFHSDQVCVVATHPETGQKRISITGRVINDSSRVAFLITGESKAGVVADILDRREQHQHLPAALVQGVRTVFYLDQAAARLLNHQSAQYSQID